MTNEVKKLTEVDILKRDSKETMWTNIIGVLVTIGVIILSILLLKYNPFKEYIETKDLGGYLSGVFAPIAWIWFILSYRLQLIELRMQRKELADSVKAQQGSEEALKNQYDTMERQSKALEKQLEITSKQYADYIKRENNKRPFFKCVGRVSSLFDKQVNFEIKNIKGQCKLLDVELGNSEYSRNLQIDFKVRNNTPLTFGEQFMLGGDPNYNDYNRYTISIMSASENHMDFVKELENTEVILHYSFADTSGESTYAIKTDGDKIDFLLTSHD